MLKKLVMKAGIAKDSKKCNIHSARHGRMTELARKVPEMHLRRFAGWTSHSDMPSKYIHVSQKELDTRVLLADGYTPEEIEEEVKPELSTKPVRCPHCGKENTYDNLRCIHCATILNEKLLMETREAEAEAEAEKQ